MQITTDKDELRRALAEKQVSHVRCHSFRTGLEALDEIAPDGHSRAAQCMNCSGHGNRPIQSRSHHCLQRQRRKMAAPSLGVIRMPSSICRPCLPQESTFDT